MQTILVVDDEPKIATLARDYLEHAGFAVVTAADGPAALTTVRQRRPDLVVLDLGLPGLDGLDVTRQLRRDSTIPIVMLTARDDELDKLIGLELGADDYVTKPFSPRELVARIRTVLRRSGAGTSTEGRIEFPDLTVDAATREVLAFGQPVELTMREFDLIEFLCRHPRQVFSRDQLMDAVWGYRSARDTGTVTVHIRRLREKLEPDPSRPQRLQTVWGVGYRFVP